LTKKSAAELIDVVFDNIGAAVRKDARFSYPGFGTWSIRTRKARKIRNPQTNEIMKLKATKTIGFRPVENAQDIIDFSSRGPSPGNRTKPEIVAPGTHVQGTASTNSGKPLWGRKKPYEATTKP